MRGKIAELLDEGTRLFTEVSLLLRKEDVPRWRILLMLATRLVNKPLFERMFLDIFLPPSNLNGRIYPPQVFKKAVEEFLADRDERLVSWNSEEGASYSDHLLCRIDTRYPS